MICPDERRTALVMITGLKSFSSEHPFATPCQGVEYRYTLSAKDSIKTVNIIRLVSLDSDSIEMNLLGETSIQVPGSGSVFHEDKFIFCLKDSESLLRGSLWPLNSVPRGASVCCSMSSLPDGVSSFSCWYQTSIVCFLIVEKKWGIFSFFGNDADSGSVASIKLCSVYHFRQFLLFASFDFLYPSRCLTLTQVIGFPA
ncbi:uncharacterized protein LY89DRAFT_403152 [Mollisia scopiformis]|uniref:Uncharacterized protein n=1 Tax=Mollisia scopiformis TaxID=149040 RepID=A0A132B2Q5_MOLSC|nr:uncharacterized protein LY89DRAFT_403152 [Mollisia scopiformis]KUJ06680.1 hypothetical protein LY89DRAFT_403152 [Mollisia scopiformis]